MTSILRLLQSRPRAVVRHLSIQFVRAQVRGFAGECVVEARNDLAGVGGGAAGLDESSRHAAYRKKARTSRSFSDSEAFEKATAVASHRTPKGAYFGMLRQAAILFIKATPSLGQDVGVRHSGLPRQALKRSLQHCPNCSDRLN